MQAVVDQSNIHCMIFEYTEQVDLHEHLALNSPSRNSTKRSKVDSASNHAFSTIDNVDFVEMAIQVSFVKLLSPWLLFKLLVFLFHFFLSV